MDLCLVEMQVISVEQRNPLIMPIPCVTLTSLFFPEKI